LLCLRHPDASCVRATRGFHPSGAPGIGPRNPGTPGGREMGGADRLGPGAKAPPAAPIVVRRRRPLRARGGTGVVSPAACRPQLGGLVWAEGEDANGDRKVRPMVVVTPTAEITIGSPCA